MTRLFPPPLTWGAMILALSLQFTSCASTTGGRASASSPEVVQAQKALLDSLKDSTAVRCHWIEATKTTTTGGQVSHDHVTGGQRQLPPLITSDETRYNSYYSDWHFADNQTLQGRQSVTHFDHVWRGKDGRVAAHDTGDYQTDVVLPLLKVDRVSVHDRQTSAEHAQAFDKEASSDTDESIWGKDTSVTLSENLTGAATVEFHLSGRRKASDQFQFVYFSSRQRAQQFVNRWNALVAALRR